MLGPFVPRCLQMETEFSIGLWASGSFHIFCNTRPGGGFVCQARCQKKKKKRGMKAFQEHRKLTSSALQFLLNWGSPGRLSAYPRTPAPCPIPHQPCKGNQLVTVLRVGSWSQGIRVTGVNNICRPRGTFNLKWSGLPQSRRS